MIIKQSSVAILLACVSSIYFSTELRAETTSEQQGYNIAAAVDKKDSGFGDSNAKISMVLTSKMGENTGRRLWLKILEDQQNGDKSLVKFDFPADIRGVSLLTHPIKSRSDEQWLYLPTVNRVKRISSRNKSGAFVGSEFSFEDMTNKNLDDYNYKFIRTEACSPTRAEIRQLANIKMQHTQLQYTQCDVIERYPVDKHSGYTKQVVWVEKTDRKITRIDYYDRKKTLLKTFKTSEFKLYNEKYWRPTIVEMSNVQTGKKTSLEYSSITFTNGLSERDFHRSALGN